MPKKQFTITKKIAKHGNQSIIVIPSILKGKIEPGTLAEIRIDIIEDYFKLRTFSTQARHSP